MEGKSSAVQRVFDEKGRVRSKKAPRCQNMQTAQRKGGLG